jgi:hypothetical protein
MIVAGSSQVVAARPGRDLDPKHVAVRGQAVVGGRSVVPPELQARKKHNKSQEKRLNDELRKVRTKIASRSCEVETCQDHPGLTHEGRIFWIIHSTNATCFG